jgi:receptor expression-enhancing protein 1/2/3/4
MVVLLVNILVAALVIYNILNAHKLVPQNRKLYRRYSRYFMVMTIFLLLDNVFFFIFYYIPFYQLFKLLVAVWLSVPMCSGAVFAYKAYIHHFLENYGEKCDRLVDEVGGTVSRYFYEYYRKASEKCAKHRGRKEEPLGIRESAVNPEEVSDSGFTTIDSGYEPVEENEIEGGRAKWNHPPDNEENKKPQ